MFRIQLFIFSAKGINVSVNTNGLREILRISVTKKTFKFNPEKKKKEMNEDTFDCFTMIFSSSFIMIIIISYYYYVCLVSFSKPLTRRFVIRFAKRQQGFEKRQHSQLMSASD